MKFRELMDIHIETMFTINRSNDLCNINRTWDKTQPAPHFFLGITEDMDIIYRFRYDVTQFIRDKTINDIIKNINYATTVINMDYIHKLLTLYDSKEYVSDICFYIPKPSSLNNNCVMFNEKYSKLLSNDEINNILDDYLSNQPCAVLIYQNEIVSVCQSVRKSNKAHEAGIDTLESYRGNGYAGKVLSYWASKVYEAGCLPLYTVSTNNNISKLVAERAGLILYGNSLYIY